MSEKYFKNVGGFEDIQNPPTPTETVEGGRERFDRKYKDCEFGEFETDTNAIKSFIQSELDLALTKERARIVEGMKKAEIHQEVDGKAYGTGEVELEDAFVIIENRDAQT